MPQPKWVTELLPEEQTELTTWLNEEKENAKKTAEPPKADGGTPPPAPTEKPLTTKDIETVLDNRESKRQQQTIQDALKNEQADFVASVKKDKADLKTKFGVDIDDKELDNPQVVQFLNANYRVAKMKNPGMKMTPGEFYVKYNKLINEESDDTPPKTEEHRHAEGGSGVSDFDKTVPVSMKAQVETDIKEFAEQWTEEAKAANEKVSEFLAKKAKEYKNDFAKTYAKTIG